MKRIAVVMAQRLRGLREKAGLSQQELAEKAGLRRSQVARLEQGKKADPRASTLLALAHGLGVRPGELLEDLLPAGADAWEKVSREEKRQVRKQAREEKKRPPTEEREEPNPTAEEPAEPLGTS